MAKNRRIPPKYKRKKLYTYLPVALFCLAALLLIGSTVGSVQATLTYISEYYDSHVDMKEIGVSLVENGKVVSYRDYADNGKWSKGTGVLLSDLNNDGKVTAADEEYMVGYKYTEELNVKNSGEIDQYVRVRVFKTWERKDSKGNWKKATDLSPEMIDLHFVTGVWIQDAKASTRERTVLYYPYILKTGASSSIFTDTLSISNEIFTKVTPTVTETQDGNKIVTTYTYDDVRFVIKCEVDAVQTHNAWDAIKSAWGVSVNMSGTQITGIS